MNQRHMPQQRAPQPSSEPAQKPAPAAPSRDPRALREKLIFALIETSPTRVGLERSQIILGDAERLNRYIMTGDLPEGSSEDASGLGEAACACMDGLLEIVNLLQKPEPPATADLVRRVSDCILALNEGYGAPEGGA